jgi:hypothetical protein
MKSFQLTGDRSYGSENAMAILMTSLLNLILIPRNRKVKLSSKRYIAVTTTLSWILWLNKKIYALELASLQQAVQVEQWFLQGWEREKKRLCRASMRALEQSFAEGSLLAEPDVVGFFLDLQALEDEGHYNQVLNELYGKGEALFDALIYPGLLHLDSKHRQQ